jgi:hypothetical protein
MSDWVHVETVQLKASKPASHSRERMDVDAAAAQ